MSISIEVIYRLCIYMILCAILIPTLTIFISLLVLANVSVLVVFLFLFLFAVEYFLLSTILTYGFGKYTVLANITYLIISLVVSLFSALNPSIS